MSLNCVDDLPRFLVLLTDTTRDEIVKIEEEEERQTVQVKTFRINIDSIMRRVDDKDLLKLLEKLTNAINGGAGSGGEFNLEEVLNPGSDLDLASLCKELGVMD